MRRVISFDKNLEFKTMIGEVTSISLDPNLQFSDDSDISGELVISGKYKLTAASRLEDDFSFSLPVEIALSEELEKETRNVYVDDFQYKVEDDDILNCHIDLVIEGVEKIDIPEEKEEILNNNLEERIPTVEDVRNDSITDEKIDSQTQLNTTNHISKVEEVEMVEEKANVTEKVEEEHSVGSLFSSFKDSDESFATYSVYIVRENDTLESIMSKYNVHREQLEDYNDLNNLVVGTKIIIPTQYE